MLEILVEDFLDGFSLQVRAGGEHIEGVLLDIDTDDLRELTCSLLVLRRAGRRAEEQGVGDDRRHQKTGRRTIDLYAALTVHHRDDRRAAAERLVSEVYRGHGLHGTDLMVIDDLEDVSRLDALDRLSGFVMIHEDDLLAMISEEISAGNHAEVGTVLTEDREITVTLVRHDVMDIIHEIVLGEGDNIILRHEVVDRHRLVDESRCGIGVVAGDHDDHAVLLGQCLDGRRNIGALTDDDAVGTVIHRRELILRTVSEEDDVVLLDIVGHHLRVCGCNQHLTLGAEALDITGNDGRLQCFLDI